MWSGRGQFHGWLADNLAPYPESWKFIREFMPMKQGLGDLLIRLPQADDGIAMYYSPAAAHAEGCKTATLCWVIRPCRGSSASRSTRSA